MTSPQTSKIECRGSRGHASLPLADAKLPMKQDEGEGEEPQGLEEVNLRLRPVKIRRSLFQSSPLRWLQKSPNRSHQRIQQQLLLLLALRPHLPQTRQAAKAIQKLANRAQRLVRKRKAHRHPHLLATSLLLLPPLLLRYRFSISRPNRRNSTYSPCWAF